MDKKEIDNIIERYLKGIASDKDLKILKQFEEFAETNFAPLNQKEAKVKTYRHVTKQIVSNNNKPHVFKNILKYAAVASIVLFISGFSYYYLNTDHKDYHIVSNTTNQPLLISLVDGSKVTLNKNTNLKYRKSDFNVKDRKLILEGNAFFEVAKNPNKPFIVSTRDLKTKVLGTSFDINASEKTILVTVSEGKVAVFNTTDTLSLKPNQQAQYADKILTSMEVDALHYNYWTMNNISLENITINRLAKILHEIYNVNFEYESEDLKQTKLTISFNRNDNIRSVVKTINIINNNPLEFKGKDVIIVKQ